MAMESAAVDAQNQGPTILAVCWLLVIIPGLMVGLRLWCKVRLSKRGFGLDDAIICVAWSLLLIYTALITRSVNLGVIGRHVFAIEDQDIIPPALKLLYISFVIIIFGCVFSKTSFAFTLLRIVTKTWMKVLIWFIIVTMNAIMWLCGICYLAQCKPAAALWNAKLLATAKCWPTEVFETIALVAGAYSGCMDVILALLPWAVIWDLEMKKREKAGIALAMSMGVIAAIAAFIKTSKLVNVSQVQDFTWFCSTITIWASVETGLTIFAASIPALRVLFVRIRSSYDQSGYPSGSYNGEEITLKAHREGSSARSVVSEHGINMTQEVTVEQNVAGVRRLDA
ncbi:uncharacterized protein N7496_002749 [Penicillium cataractarum]|uniref:Rhodopsin domain-containing protein n=1 Tax=Penicillium cataractarum TaxID=2100454 RepID=A0A9W9VI54_9EURO|nr:uncharacterized protein N7496_002749 [Penicillium cataractarum]KAJ5380321.1 hypothetical protein N7496_002749 [Penicillium cataractarum]